MTAWVLGRQGQFIWRYKWCILITSNRQTHKCRQWRRIELELRPPVHHSPQAISMADGPRYHVNKQSKSGKFRTVTMAISGGRTRVYESLCPSPRCWAKLCTHDLYVYAVTYQSSIILSRLAETGTSIMYPLCESILIWLQVTCFRFHQPSISGVIFCSIVVSQSEVLTVLLRFCF